MTTTDPRTAAITFDDRPDVFIGGKWVESTSDEWIDVIDSWSEGVVARVRSASADDVAAAVGAARASFDAGVWASTPIEVRADVIDEIANRLDARLPELIQVGIAEVGVTVPVSAMTQEMTIGLFRAVANEARNVTLVDERTRADGGVSHVVKEPNGVAGVIIPWNGPIGTIAFKAIPALAAGCSIVLKTSPEAPLSPSIFADVIGELVAEGRIPEGVVSVVAADREVSEALVVDPRVDHVTFTGSTAVGRRIMALASERVAKVSLELGGKSAAIVLDDADLSSVMQSLPMGGCMQSGQACIALTRVLVSEKRHDEVVAAYKAALDMLPLGDPWQETNFLGPLASARQRDRVEAYIESAKSEGATIAHGGGRGGFDHGYFVEPTIVDNVTNDMSIAQEEVFGPVISIITYKDEDDAVAIANDSQYGLSGAVFSADAERAYEIAKRIRTGTVNVNGGVIDFTIPFGGYKQSGVGREGGPEGLDEFFETKTIHLS
ncbi:aldehyde dehydrogenase [Gordonia sp. HY285]|uniref:aldehyde dehydrogenase n=1 Tax=Gordonia liuliyuniae TaxID=2911517 RepID=UPI001F229038|nr:aldehyde dehydrogenase [Gordonia liuliyuniae]MCF8610133.1 aldehyde dehydrogenase [Gordonia liuliyuniae]